MPNATARRPDFPMVNTQTWGLNNEFNDTVLRCRANGLDSAAAVQSAAEHLTSAGCNPVWVDEARRRALYTLGL